MPFTFHHQNRAEENRLQNKLSLSQKYRASYYTSKAQTRLTVKPVLRDWKSLSDKPKPQAAAALHSGYSYNLEVALKSNFTNCLKERNLGITDI